MTSSEASSVRPYRLSVVVPSYNEALVLEEFHRRLSLVMDQLGQCRCEVIYVNDGSSDATLSVQHRLRLQDDRVGIVSLSRNFGKEIALTAGLAHACGDAVVVIDADLQDPPEVIPEMIRYWLEGFDVVYAKRTARDGETLFKRLTAHLFYRTIQRVSRVSIPEDVGDFRLLSRRALDAVLRLPERNRFMKGIFAWVGFSQMAVQYRRDPRYAGETKWNYWKLWNLAIEGITSFTTAPLKVASYVGLIVSLWAFVYAIWIVYKTLVFGDVVRGYPTLIVVVLFLGGVQLIALGLIGEYIGRMFDETKQRPLYLLDLVESSALHREHIDSAEPAVARAKIETP